MKWTSFFISTFFPLLWAYKPCPSWIYQDGIANDLGYLSDVVSWDGGYHQIHGVCGDYHLLAESEGIYDTRMRIYENGEDAVIIFRPTQQTREGGDIHVNRQLVSCVLFPNCTGLVNDRFQRAFLDMIQKLPQNLIQDRLCSKKILLTGHSLGGSLQLMMAIYLWSGWGILPEISLGLAGPFIGDEVFTRNYQKPFLEAMDQKWWQIEAVHKYNGWDVDGTVSGYQVDHSPFLYIQQEAICRLSVNHLSDSYGMHDLKNYRTGLKGTKC